MRFRIAEASFARALFPAVTLALLSAGPATPQHSGPRQARTDGSPQRARRVARFVPGRILVLFDPATADEDAERTVSIHRGRTIGRDIRIGLRVVELAPGQDEEAALSAVRAAPGVAAAELDEIIEPEQQVTPNDPLFSSQTHLKYLKAPEAWARTTGSPAVVVAVIDTGVNTAHPDFAGRVVPGWNTYDNNSNTADVAGHGTKVAGTVIATSNNAVGVASVCWNCMLMPIRASQPNGAASYSALAAGLTWAADRGAKVANLSYQISSSSTVTAAAQYFMQKGGLVFAAAGNYGTNDPAPDNPFIVTVNGLDTSTGNLYSWSNYGNNIDVSAPGCTGMTTLANSTYGTGCGTSYSTPMAAGVAALVYSVNPNFTPAEVLEILKSSATDLGAPGWDILFGHGAVNAESAVLMAVGLQSVDTRAPSITVLSPVSGAKVKGVIAASASVTDAEGKVRSVVFKIGAATLCTFAAAPYSCSIDTRAFPDGQATFSVVAEDDSGNVATAQSPIMIENADVTKPVVSLIAPAPGATVGGSVTVSFSATDDVGVVGITVTVGSTTVCSVAGTATSCVWDTTRFANGSAVLTITARDAAGNSQGVSRSVTIYNADTTAPSVTLLSPASGAAVNGVVQITFTVSDNIAVTQTTVTAGSSALCSFNGPASSCQWDTSKSPNGSVTLVVTARDAAGNSRSASRVVTVSNPIGDAIRPTVSFTSPSTGTTVSGLVQVSVASSDNVGVVSLIVSANGKPICNLGGGVTSCTWSTQTFPNGTCSLVASAQDAAGNSTSVSLNLTVSNPVQPANSVDTVKPMAVITSPPAGSVLKGILTVGFAAYDNVAVTKTVVRLNTTTLCTVSAASGTCTLDTAKFADGGYNLVAVAYDAAGNGALSYIPVTVANTAPLN